MQGTSDPSVLDERLAPGAEIEPEQISEGPNGGDGVAVGTDVVEEPTAAPDVEGSEEEEAGDLQIRTARTPIVQPQVPLLFLKKRNVSGRYRSLATGWLVELRVDVDGSKAMMKISGDFFKTSGGTTSYFGSFVVKAPAVTKTDSEVKAQGMGTFTWAAGAPFVRVTIPRVSILQAPKPATLQFITPPSTPGAQYACSYASPYFRTVQWEQDCVTGTVPFVSYDTGSLPQPASSSPRVLTVSRAFREAGVDLQAAGIPNVIPASAAGADLKWNDSELHNAMVNHFSLFANQPQWRVWLLVATQHVGGYRGIMFDYSDAFQRQGCAVFYSAIKGSDAATQRAQLRTYVHELGHAFNLLHSWQKNLANPPAPLGPNGGLGDLSWMNYAWKYQPPPPDPGGEAAYWANFPFQFTNNELVHLRHGFYKNVIMGANAFGKGAAEVDPEMFDEPITDNSGLSLELRAKDAFEFGEPVVVELKLMATDLRGRQTHGYLHPNDDFVSVAIREPSGRTRVFQPLLRRCADEDRTIQLDPGRPAIYDSAYVGFGKDGFYFAEPGHYQVRAQYIAADGSRLMSPILDLWVRPPVSREDEIVGELLLDDQQGQLLSLLGSHSEALVAGNAALDAIVEEHPDHPLAVYAKLAKGINAERDFKYLSPDKQLRVRKHDSEESVELLSAVEQESIGGEGVDNITLNMAMRCHAHAEAKAGNLERATEVMDRMVEVFEDKGLNPFVLDRIRAEADATKSDIAEIAGETDEGSAG